MVLTGSGRLFHAESSRTIIYVSQKIVNDSAFPFAAGDALLLTVDPKGERMIVEKAPTPA